MKQYFIELTVIGTQDEIIKGLEHLVNRLKIIKDKDIDIKQMEGSYLDDTITVTKAIEAKPLIGF